MERESIVLAEQRMLNAWRRVRDLQSMFEHLSDDSPGDTSLIELGRYIVQCEADLNFAVQLHASACSYARGEE